ncbi:MAG UNVERIFIED_CONTAM: hypothetical protein LVT10_25650 [Anaerolineae bacterium]
MFLGAVWMAFGMTALGLTLFALSGDSSNGVAINFPLGISLTIAGAILFAVHVIVTHRVLDGYPTTARVTAWIITGYGVILIPLTLMGKMVPPSDWKTFLLLAELASFNTVLPAFAFMMGMMRSGTSSRVNYLDLRAGDCPHPCVSHLEGAVGCLATIGRNLDFLERGGARVPLAVATQNANTRF